MMAAVGITAFLIVCYLVSCNYRPYKDCQACHGGRRTYSGTYKGAFGPCRPCKGTGFRLRAGARILGKKP